MAPIRIVIIGLAPNSNPQPDVGNWGVIAHLKPILASPKYELVGVCNSSAASAQRSIDFHELPSTVRAYDSIDEVAADPNVDLVAVSVNVVSHKDLTQPLVAAGKNVLVEWPLASTTKDAEDLAAAAAASGSKTAVGLQFRADPMLKKVGEMLKDGVIGEVRSSSVLGCSSTVPADMWIEHATYYLSMKTGGNEFTIYFGHFLDGFTHVLGDFSTLSAIVKNYTPTVPLVDLKTGSVSDPAYPKEAPDHVFVQGELASGAIASIAWRKALKPADALGVRWLITGDKGEIEVTMPEDHVQQGNEKRSLRLRLGREAEVKDVVFGEGEAEHVTKAPYPGTSTGRLYEEYANGGDAVATFEDSVKTHKLLDRILSDAKYAY